MVGNTTDDFLDWIFDDDQKNSANSRRFHGIMTRPYRNEQDVEFQLQRLRERGIALGDPKVDTFIGKGIGTDTAMSHITPEIDKENELFQDEMLEKIDTADKPDDLGEIQLRLDSEGNTYRPITFETIDTALRAKIKELEPVARVAEIRRQFVELRRDVARVTTIAELDRIDIPDDWPADAPERDQLADLLREKDLELIEELPEGIIERGG